MAESTQPEMISMELSTSGRDDCHFRIRAGPLVKYITLAAGALDAFALLDMPTDFAAILPPLDYGSKDWNQARVERSGETKELVAVLEQTALAAVTDAWHPVELDILELEKTEEMSLLTGEYLWNRNGTKTMVIAKMARFPWEIASIDAETQAYKALTEFNLGPKFLGHVQENGRIIGFALEKLHGRRHARPDDIAVCQAALGQLHSRGISHGNVKGNHFLVDDDEDNSVVIVDFAQARVAAAKDELEAEHDNLALGLREESDGGDEFDGVIYEEEDEDE
ncbi:hypothetical protein NLG97_g7466 [Lecanicillium saksenae]|uniref:Uncharacterized protein n=1 Tax=Lecanicillium saksenae TaxID=468837 RepID=A0ACC1QLR1_9HYPO|nr:hypothetical protein NLG97_g7466 [Lecanicillium saksenae]